jgi:hypothetical protein
VATAVAVTGPGSFSIDSAWNINQSLGVFALPMGVACAVCHLTLCWRPQKKTPTA